MVSGSDVWSYDDYLLKEKRANAVPLSGQSNATYPVCDRSPNIVAGKGIKKDQTISKHAGKLHRTHVKRTLELSPTSMKEAKPQDLSSK